MIAAIVIVMIAMVVVVTIAAIVIPVIAVAIPVIAMFVVVAMRAVVRNVPRAVPVVPHEQHGLTACAVLAAVSAPISLVARPYVQVHRITAAYFPLDDNRSAIDQSRRRRVAQVDAPIEIRLSDIDRQSDLGRYRCGHG